MYSSFSYFYKLPYNNFTLVKLYGTPQQPCSINPTQTCWEKHLYGYNKCVLMYVTVS